MPTPNDMPGAATDADGVESKPPENEPQGGNGTDGQEDDDLVTGAVEDPQAEIERLRKIVRQGRKFEDRARKNADKARLWDENAEKVKNYDELIANQKTEAQRDKERAEKAEADLAAEKLNGLRRDIAAELGVPSRFVTGKTESEMRESAEEYLEERAKDIEKELKAKGISPAAPANAVTSDGKGNEVKQLTRADLQSMKPQAILAAKKAGQLDELLGKV